MVAPLAGLLGTVIGMIETFQAITLFGTGDPKTMAGGISTALDDNSIGYKRSDTYNLASFSGSADA